MINLCIPHLRERYSCGELSPQLLFDQLLRTADAAPARNIWITRLSRDQVMRHVAALEGRRAAELPLYGIPFVIKDNIDLQGITTTAGCPAYGYVAQHSAGVVQRLLDAGAIPLGKTNMDQFATGLVGVRSPYGACRNGFDADFISGGSSSGSAVAVATGLASFALGTDTAGSGRVPAAFNNIVGLKPSLGRLSTSGVVPACRSLDAVSIFALTAGDAATVLDVAQGYDAGDAYSRIPRDCPIGGMRFGVPPPHQRQFFGDLEYAQLFEQAIARLQAQGGTPITIDFAPFLEAAQLLYAGPWVAERHAAVGDFLAASPEAVLPVTREIIGGAQQYSATSAFRGQYRLMALKRAAEQSWSQVDLILTPTAGTLYRIAEVEAEPLRLNANLGYYTNFMNLFDLAGVAIPAGFRRDGLPFGVTLVGRAWTERALLALGDRLHHAGVRTLGALDLPLPAPAAPATAPLPGWSWVAVCGAHMSGLPLNHQLTARGGFLVQATRTSANYRLFALPGGPPQRPGLVRVADAGTTIDLEVWALPSVELGSFLAAVPAPLCIGKVELADGSSTLGFLCEAHAAADAVDISQFGGWRRYQASMDAR
jgi:allophanate hydrolase